MTQYNTKRHLELEFPANDGYARGPRRAYWDGEDLSYAQPERNTALDEILDWLRLQWVLSDLSGQSVGIECYD